MGNKNRLNKDELDKVIAHVEESNKVKYCKKDFEYHSNRFKKLKTNSVDDFYDYFKQACLDLDIREENFKIIFMKLFKDMYEHEDEFYENYSVKFGDFTFNIEYGDVFYNESPLDTQGFYAFVKFITDTYNKYPFDDQVVAMSLLLLYIMYSEGHINLAVKDISFCQDIIKDCKDLDRYFDVLVSETVKLNSIAIRDLEFDNSEEGVITTPSLKEEIIEEEDSVEGLENDIDNFDDEYFRVDKESSKYTSVLKINTDSSITVLLDGKSIFTTFDVNLAKSVSEDVNKNIDKLYCFN